MSEEDVVRPVSPKQASEFMGGSTVYKEALDTLEVPGITTDGLHELLNDPQENPVPATTEGLAKFSHELSQIVNSPTMQGFIRQGSIGYNRNLREEPLRHVANKSVVILGNNCWIRLLQYGSSYNSDLMSRTEVPTAEVKVRTYDPDAFAHLKESDDFDSPYTLADDRAIDALDMNIWSRSSKKGQQPVLSATHNVSPPGFHPERNGGTEKVVTDEWLDWLRTNITGPASEEIKVLSPTVPASSA